MGRLLCPNCMAEDNPASGCLKWVSDMDTEDLLDNGVMECQVCKTQYVGIPGWQKAWEEKGRPF